MNRALVDVTAWTLLHSIWQGAIIAGIAGVLTTCMQRASARARYRVLAVALVMFVAATGTTAVALQRMMRAGNASASVSAGTLQGVALPASVSPTTTVPEARNLPAIIRQSRPVIAMTGVIQRSLVRDRVMPALVVVWLMGVLAGAVRALGGWLVLRRMIARAVPPPAPLLASAQQIARTLGLVRFERIRLRISAEVQVPFTMGLLRPIIVLPLSILSGLPALQVEALIAHELAHVRRWDHLINALQAFARTMLFYHPATWWLNRRLDEEREYCCDDLAVGVTQNRVEYLRALTELEALRIGLPLLALAANGGVLRQRVERLLGTPVHAPTAGWIPALAVVVLLAGVPGVDAQPGTTTATSSAIPWPASHAPTGADKETTPMVPSGRARIIATTTASDQAPVTSTNSPVEQALVTAAIATPDLAPVPAGITVSEQPPVPLPPGVVFSPNPSATAAEQWNWARTEAFRYTNGVVIGWRVRSARMDDDLVLSSTDASSRLAGQPVAARIGARGSDARGVAVLLTTVSGLGSQITAVRLRSMSIDVNLDNQPLLWLGTFDDAASLALLEQLMTTVPSASLRSELGAALTLHDDRSRMLTTVKRVLENERASVVRAEIVQWLGNDASRAIVELWHRLAFDDPSFEVRAEAVDALKGASGRQARQALQDVARRHPDATLREEARDALQEGLD